MNLHRKHDLYISTITNGNASQNLVEQITQTAFTTFSEEVEKKVAKNLRSTRRPWETIHVIYHDMVIGQVIQERDFYLLRLSGFYSIEVIGLRQRMKNFLRSIGQKLLDLI